MTARDALLEALRASVVPAVRARGFKGSAPTWRRANQHGDWAVVTVQSSRFGTLHDVRCVVNVALAPEPWLRWLRARAATPMPRSVTEYLGLYRTRLHPTGTPEGHDAWWEIHDATSARAAATDMARRLSADGLPALDRLSTRDGMLDELRHGSLGRPTRASVGYLCGQGEALLLMDGGPSDALDAALASTRTGVREEQRDEAWKFGTWVRGQAERAGHPSA